MQKEGICDEGRRPAAGWESVNKIPPRGRRVGGGRLGFERRREEGVVRQARWLAWLAVGGLQGLLGRLGRASGARRVRSI